MTIDKLIKGYFYDETNKINIECPEEEDEIINILYDKFNKTDWDFYNKCYDLICAASSKNQYNSFISGFKHGFECCKSLNDFLNKQ